MGKPARKKCLAVIKTMDQRRSADAKAMLIQLADAGFDHVTVIGYLPDGKLYIKSSATDSFEEDIMRLEMAKLQKWQSSSGR